MTLAQDADRAQRKAADGNRSVWVSASAGSGKTKVLTDRVLNLLLSGAGPDRLLCLTFTKAAAAEMANRINARLSRWTAAGEAALRGDILDLTGSPPDPETVKTARRLFARVLDTPGGMRIMTIHAFCQSILRRFPLEAGIIPNFEVTDDRSAAELQTEARNAVLSLARETPESPLAMALAEITSRVQEQGFAEVLSELQRQRGRLQTALARLGGAERYIDELRRDFGVAENATARDCLITAASEDSFDGAALRQAARQMALSDKVTDQQAAALLGDWLAATQEQRVETWESYIQVYLTSELSRRANLATKSLCKAHPWLGAALAREADRIEQVQAKLASIAAVTASAAIARFAEAFLDRYALEKRRRGVLDYDDLILATRDLLDRPGIAPWVLFKLDGGIDHILIDEAQDTNPDQWQVIEALAGEFFVGEAASPRNRTLFAVGDPKQSIYSFQGADPQRFLSIGEKFRTLALAAQREFASVPLDVSFRSTQAVLNLVDQVFAQTPARDGVAFDNTPIRHYAFRGDAPGRIELWPMIEPRLEDETMPWAHPVEQKFAEAPRGQLATEIAGTIRHWIASGERLGSKGRAIRGGDIMVLVRRRNAFVRDLIRALKASGIGVAGADRIVLTQQLAVMDLMALGRFLLLPEDDLTLAGLLKSPLFGVSEEQLFKLCNPRGGESLWQRLRQTAQEHPILAEATQTLSALLARADFVSPHALFAEVLGARAGRRRLISRLGPEATDAIDEFLNQCLAYERVHVPSLQGFLQWLDQSDADIKRDLDQGTGDEVRIMTVHGSKGLQAPIVFLPDTVAMPERVPPLLWSQSGFLLWAPGIAKSAGPIAAARDQAALARDQEYRRLLYVALTRAEDRIYICGWRGKRTPASGNWHELVDLALQELPGNTLAARTCPPDGVTAPALVYSRGTTIPIEPSPDIETPAAEIAPLPSFLTAPPPKEPLPPRPLAALRPAVSDPPSRSPLVPSDDEQRFKRGTIIHRLLQSLPDLPASARSAAAGRYLARPGLALEPEEQRIILQETLAVLEYPEFEALFGPGSLAEVPVVGVIGANALSGRIDRLVVTPHDVLIVDYKTNRPPSRKLEDVPQAYLDQLDAYRQALRGIYPDKKIRTFLLWTVGPFILEVPGQSAAVAS